MPKFGFRVYVDESGDEGFVFNPDGSGSSRWFVLSAVVTPISNDPGIVGLMKTVRTRLGRKPKQSLHFQEMPHTQRVAYTRMLGESAHLLQTVSVVVHKPSIQDPSEYKSNRNQLYRCAAHKLLELVSFCCEDLRAIHGDPNPAEVIFSNRDQMSYPKLRESLRDLPRFPEPFAPLIDWSIINPDHVRPVQHDQLAGLQFADAVASGLFNALNTNPYGDVEDRYARLLAPTFYHHQGRSADFGIHFWPWVDEPMKKANPHIAWLAEGG